MLRSKSVLIIVQNLPLPFDRRVWQEATSLQRAGYRVTAICPKGKGYTQGREEIDGIVIYRYPQLYEANRGVIGYFIEFIYSWLATLILSGWAYVRRPYKVIHACNPPETYFALALLFRPFGVRFIFDHHDLSPEMYLAKDHKKGGFLYRGLLFLERWTLKTAHHVIEVNESHRQVAIDRGGINPEKITIVRSGPRADWSHNTGLSPQLRNGKENLVIYLGEMCEQDGVDYLLRSIRHFLTLGKDDTQFTLIGGGPELPTMQRLAKSLELEEQVHFTGRVPDGELKEYLAIADVGVDPDPWTEWSNMSTMNKIIEYMAFGTPIVAFDLREHRQTAAEAAVYIKPNDEIAFAEAVRDLLDDPGRRSKMSAFARDRFVRHLAWEKSEKALLEVYGKVLPLEEV